MGSRWDNVKEETNWWKHHVHFEEASTIFNDPLIVVVDDPEHSHVEDRYVAIGQTNQKRLVVVTYTIRDDEPWLINAREAEPRERRRYMSGMVRDGDEEMLPYYDFSGGVRGKHYQGGSRTMVGYGIEEEIAKYFPTSEDVNNALRALIAEGRVPESKK